MWQRNRTGVRWLSIVALLLATASCTPESIHCEPSASRDLSTSADHVTLHLWISNQSSDIDPVDIVVYIDDQQIVCGSFDVEDQHNWILFDVLLDSGRHELRAIGHDGQVVLTETIEVPEERWAVLDFWFYPDDEPERFTFRIQDQPIGFD